MESQRLGEANTALKVLLKHREEDREELEKTVLYNIGKLVAPYLEKLGKTALSPLQRDLAETIRTNLQDVVSPFLRTLTSQYLNMTPREIEVANLVKEGKTAKEIAELLNSSIRSIEFHKNSIRKKLGLVNRKTNLRSHLLSLSAGRR
jgi:DNA-binding CsgD family transcriptional regulator